MRRFLAFIFMLCLAIPAGISISGCARNPAGNSCNGLGYGLSITSVYSIDLEPRATGVSMAFGQTRTIATPTAKTCKGTAAGVSTYTYGTTNNQLVDISPAGTLCAGRWNRNSGGGIADFTICNVPNPLPSTGGLPYSTAYITAAAQSVTSNQVEVYVHAPVAAISLSLPSSPACYSQGAIATLDSEACYVNNGVQYEFCAPPTVTSYSCQGGLQSGVSSVPDCTAAIGVATYTVGTSSVASINSETNQITAELPGTTAITASVAQSGSSAGYFSTCPPKSISLALANGSTTGTVTQGVVQNLTTTVIDTQNNPITGLTLDYQSTNPLDITAGAGGAITASFPGAASVYAICQPSDCNVSPINQIGAGGGTGLSISSNAVNITTPGTASAFMWFSAPGKSQYFVPIELLSATVGSNVRLPYVPNSMVMDQTGTNLYFGSSHELMIYGTSSNSITKQDPTVPGVVLAVSPNNGELLINDPVRQVFYIYAASGTVTATFGGLGSAAQWTQDSKTLYISDSSALNDPANGITGHTDTLYVYNANTGWTTYPLAPSDPTNPASNPGAQKLALTVPGVGAFLSGSSTVAHTWCPTGSASTYSTISFYPQPPDDSVAALTQVLASTTDGQHILGAAAVSGVTTFSDISVTVPTGPCPEALAGQLQPLSVPYVLNPPQTLSVNATGVNQIVTSPAAVTQGTAATTKNLSFITYNGTTTGATLPYYTQAYGAGTPGTVGYVTLNGASVITAPVAGAFSSDGTLFFVSTAGDNLIHYVNTTTLTDTQQINVNLPACTPGSDPDCTITTPQASPVPATAIAVKPRATT